MVGCCGGRTRTALLVRREEGRRAGTRHGDDFGRPQWYVVGMDKGMPAARAADEVSDLRRRARWRLGGSRRGSHGELLRGIIRLEGRRTQLAVLRASQLHRDGT